MRSGAPASIVTPTLNAARYLKVCLASVRDQQVDGLEHLVVDGGSTDATAEIVRRHDGVRWLARPNWNQARAINEGLRSSTGGIVAWLNADDVYPAAAVRYALDRFDTEPDLDVLYGDCEVIGPEAELLWWERPGPYDFRRLLRRGNYIAQPAVFLRRRIFDVIGYLDETLEYGMDYDLWLRLRELHVGYVPRSLGQFRWHANSKTARSQLASWNEFLRILNQHGGGSTPELVWAYARCLVTLGRLRIGSSITGSVPLRPLTRGSA